MSQDRPPNPYSSPVAEQAATGVEDPVVRSARREALVVLAIWLAAMTYTVGYCYLFGYGRSVEDLRFVLGFPDWIFWGILAPWFVCLATSWWFSFGLMTDADLGQDPDEAETESTEAGNA